MKLIAYLLPDQSIDLRPAPVNRDWMDATGERYAYRCLPLAIANAHGWEILCPAGFAATWAGGPELDQIEIVADPGSHAPAVSHFGQGILTFHIPCLFRTEPGFDLMAQGPVNRPKDAIAPLSGVIETDWAPFTFTMNWQLTRPGQTIRFEKGEPFAHVFPIRRGELERITPEIRDLADDPDLKAQFEEWTASRNKFLADSKTPGTDAMRQKWQKHYYRGTDLSGAPVGGDDHRTRIRVAPFERQQGDGRSEQAVGLGYWRSGLGLAASGIAALGPVKRDPKS